jgi:LuxR family transcriptional regulator, regulator of acetate metabolism
VSAGIQPLFLSPERGLSPRQADVLLCAAVGCTERETALRLGIATATVRGHLARARERPGARSTCQAVAVGMIEVPCVS